MKSKSFNTNQLNRINRKEKCVWFIFPIIFLFLVLCFAPNTFKGAGSNHSFALVFLFCEFSALISLVIGIVPFFILKSKFEGTKKEVLRNCTFINMQDIDYYRDKLTGLNPGEISLLENLQIEAEKDISASILHYERLGILVKENGMYIKNEMAIKNAVIRKSDLYLIEQIIAETFRQEKVADTWSKMVLQEAKKDGLIDERFFQYDKEKTGRKNGRGALLWFLILVIFSLLAMPGLIRDGDQSLKQNVTLPDLPEWVYAGGEVMADAINILEAATLTTDNSNEQLLLVSKQPYYKIITAGFVGFLMMLLLFWPIFYASFGIARMKGWSNYKRTDLGNEYSEYVWGMKNFIHDFSNLKDKEKEQLVLWDDYLIYAVVLEENKIIVDQIMQRRKSI